MIVKKEDDNFNKYFFNKSKILFNGFLIVVLLISIIMIIPDVCNNEYLKSIFSRHYSNRILKLRIIKSTDNKDESNNYTNNSVTQNNSLSDIDCTIRRLINSDKYDEVNNLNSDDILEGIEYEYDNNTKLIMIKLIIKHETTEENRKNNIDLTFRVLKCLYDDKIKLVGSTTIGDIISVAYTYSCEEEESRDIISNYFLKHIVIHYVVISPLFKEYLINKLHHYITGDYPI